MQSQNYFLKQLLSCKVVGKENDVRNLNFNEGNIPSNSHNVDAEITLSSTLNQQYVGFSAPLRANTNSFSTTHNFNLISTRTTLKFSILLDER